MGTSGAYTGAGGKAGKDVGKGLGDWLDSLPGSQSEGTSNPPGAEADEKPVTQLPPTVVSGLMSLLRPRPANSGSSDGPGGVGGGIATGGGSASRGTGRVRAGSGRSSRRLASVGGRAAAGAYAYARGDAAGLRSLGLDYAELRELDDPLDVTRRIVEAVCGQQADGSLEEAEERYVAASVADWVLTQSEDSELPDAEDVARYTIAAIVTEVLSSEIAEALRERPQQVADIAEDELRAAAEVLARQAKLRASGPTEDELTEAIEESIEKLREIYIGGS